MSVNTIMAMEQGRVADPGFFTVASLADGLGMNLDQLRQRARPSISIEGTKPMNHGVVSVGYEGRTVAEFVADLQRHGVTLLADVRLTPLSRKPGFSKTRLAAALAQAGIDYRHFRCLGNPKENRASFRSDQAGEGRRVFGELMKGPEARDALGELSDLATNGVVAVLCFERDHDECHRKVIVDQILDGRAALPVATMA